MKFKAALRRNIRAETYSWILVTFLIPYFG